MANKPLITPAGIAVYPHLNAPDTKFNPDGDYRTGLRLAKADAQALLDKLTEIAEAGYQEACKEQKKPKLKRADLPIKDETDEDGNETGFVVINFKAKAKLKDRSGKVFDKKIGLFDAKGKAVDPAKNAIWGGSKIKVAFDAVPFYVPALGAGLSLRLKGVQILELVSGGAGSAESLGFQKEDGFEVSEEAPVATEETGDVATADEGNF